MKIIVINAGSSSLRYKLFEINKTTKQISKGHIDNIGKRQKIKNHQQALDLLFANLVETKTLKSLKEIDAIGHRVVHGGDQFTKPTKITPRVIKQIKKLYELAPLHNPANIAGIKAAKKRLPRTPQVAIFDTAFHQTMPAKAYRYAIPQALEKKHKIRRYGFHGTSHNYVIDKALKLMRKKKAKIISCHIGNGSSITAFNGKVIDTSMGFTPLEGIMMGTRCGSIDPSIPLYLAKKLKTSNAKVEEILNNQSGLKGFSNISHDMRDIYAQSKKKNPQALLTIETLAYQIAKYCGGYAAALQGLDAIIFTGGMGIKASYVRKQACDYLKHLGLALNHSANRQDKQLISTPKSKIKVYVIETDEELQIAKETFKLLK